MKPRNVPGKKHIVSFENLLEDWDAAQWSIACREMQIRIAHGSFEGAHAVLNRFIQASRPKFATLDSSVVHIFDARIAALLEREGLKTIRVLDRQSDERLDAIQGIGPRQLKMIRTTIAEIKQGTRPEISSQDGLKELIDEEHGYTPESLSRNSRKAIERAQHQMA